MAIKSFIGKVFTKEYLLITNTILVPTLLSTGDVIEQRVVEKIRQGENAPEQDWERTGRMFKSGLVVGPFLHYWYKFLDGKYPGNAMKIIVRKSIVDYIFGVAISAVAWDTALAYLENKDLKENFKTLIYQRLGPIYLGNIVFMTPAQVVNFYFVPPKFRVLFLMSAALVWSVGISFIHHEIGNENQNENKSKITELESTPQV